MTKVLKVTPRKNTERNFSTLSPIIKYYNCQDYGHVVVNYLTPFNIVIIDRVFIKAPNSDSTISPKATHMIKEFSVVSPAVTVIVSFVATTTVVHPFPSLVLLLTPPSPLLLLPTLSVIACTCR